MDKYFVNTLWTSCNLAQMEHYLLLPGCMQRPVAFIITRLTFFFFLYFTNNSLCKELYVNKYGYLHLSFIPLCWVCVPILYLLYESFLVVLYCSQFVTAVLIITSKWIVWGVRSWKPKKAQSINIIRETCFLTDQKNRLLLIPLQKSNTISASQILRVALGLLPSAACQHTLSDVLL